jgi:hypothetical protein
MGHGDDGGRNEKATDLSPITVMALKEFEVWWFTKSKAVTRVASSVDSLLWRRGNLRNSRTFFV